MGPWRGGSLCAVSVLAGHTRCPVFRLFAGQWTLYVVPARRFGENGSRLGAMRGYVRRALRMRMRPASPSQVALCNHTGYGSR